MKKQFLAVGVNGDGVGRGPTPEDAIEDLRDLVDGIYNGEFKIEEVQIWEVIRAGRAKITIEWEA